MSGTGDSGRKRGHGNIDEVDPNRIVVSLVVAKYGDVLSLLSNGPTRVVDLGCEMLAAIQAFLIAPGVVAIAVVIATVSARTLRRRKYLLFENQGETAVERQFPLSSSRTQAGRCRRWFTGSSGGRASERSCRSIPQRHHGRVQEILLRHRLFRVPVRACAAEKSRSRHPNRVRDRLSVLHQRGNREWSRQFWLHRSGTRRNRSQQRRQIDTRPGVMSRRQPTKGFSRTARSNTSLSRT